MFRTHKESMAPPDDFSSFELKLARGQHHLQEAKDLIERWVAGTNKTLVEEPDPKVPGAHGTWVTPPAFPDDDITLIIGDCLQCFRSALDHLAFELASASGISFTDDLKKASEFPIFGPAQGFGGVPPLAQ
jgi:hypothetical protein